MPIVKFIEYIINLFNSAPISLVFVMAVFLVGLAQFKIIMEILRNDLKRMIQMQMEHQYKNENLHSIAADVLRRTFTLFHSA